jgi:hypothetical protein
MTHLFHQKYQHQLKNSPETKPEKKMKSEDMVEEASSGFIWMTLTNKNILKSFDEKICNKINKSGSDIVEFNYKGKMVSLDKDEMTIEYDDRSKIPVYKYLPLTTKPSSPERKNEQEEFSPKNSQRREENSSYSSPKSSKSKPGSFYDNEEEEEDYRPSKPKNSKKSSFSEENEEEDNFSKKSGKWSWKSDKGFVSYDLSTAKELEMSYSNNKKGNCTISGHKGKEYIVDFKRMLQYPSGDESKMRPVKRE